ncbi:hypothetical protein [Streptomyces monomycini]|uniref:hypothetical protein n=1 Tax=Streptomyces monomycini TaxID=371720 RepID=UPI0004AA7DB6|nr:hypothetical protein [Streptomyces monomycini]
MKEPWKGEYDPDTRHVTGGLPAEVVAEVEHLVGQLVELAEVGVDITDMGYGPRPGGLRRMDAAGGYFFFLPLPRSKLVAVTRVIPPFASL